MLQDSPQFADGPFCTTEGKNREGTWEEQGMQRMSMNWSNHGLPTLSDVNSALSDPGWSCPQSVFYTHLKL